MENPKTMASETGKNSASSIIVWIDNLAKIIVVITALLYIIGRNYTESYYTHMGIPTSNIPLTPQEYLFMSTKSLSFLKSALSTSLISVATGFIINLVAMLFESLFSRNSENDKRISSSSDNSGKNVEEENNNKSGVSKIQQDNKKTLDNNSKNLAFPEQLKAWLKSNLVYIIPAFIVLFFVMLIPSAQASGGVDSEDAIQHAPLGRILLNQPSIPELTPKIYEPQKDTILYDYGMLPVIGILGENYLLVLENQNGKKSILAIPVSDVVSINYISYISLTPMPTSLETPTITPSPTETTTPSPTP